MPQRGAPVLGAGERGHVGGGGIVHRADAALRDRDPDEHRGDRLRHRPRGEAVPVVPRVLIAFDEDRVTAGDEEPGGGVAREVVVKGECLALVLVADCRFRGRARQRRRRRGTAHQPTLKDLVEMAVGADEEGWTRAGRAVADRIATRSRRSPRRQGRLGRTEVPPPLNCSTADNAGETVPRAPVVSRRCTTGEDGGEHTRSR